VIASAAPVARSGFRKVAAAPAAATRHWDLAFVGVLAYVFVEYTRIGNMYPIIGQMSPGKVVVAIAALGYLLTPRPTKQGSGGSASIDFWLVALLLAGFLSACFAPHQDKAWGQVVDMLRYAIICFLISRVVTNSWRMRIFFLLYILLNFKLAQFVIRNYMLDVARGMSQAALAAFGVGAGSVGFFSNAADFGVAMCVAWPIAMYLIPGEKNRYFRLGYMIAAAAFIISLLVAGTRGGVVGAVGIGIAALAKNGKRLATVAMAGILLLGIVFVLPEGMREKFRSAEDPTKDQTANNRLLLWKAGWRMFKDAPILGVGPANFPMVRSEHYATPDLPAAQTVPHSTYIEVLSQFGILGSVSLLGLWFSIFRLNRKTRKLMAERDPEYRRSMEYSLATGLDLALIGFLGSGAFVAVFTYPHIWVLAGLTAGLHASAREETVAAPAEVRIKERKTSAAFA
jgi:putative inorganic carbon (hco3(-)) transporter